MCYRRHRPHARKQHRPWMAVAFAAFALARAGAETGLPRFTLEASLEIALRDAAAMAEARIDERIAETRYGMERARILPHLSAHASYTRQDEATRFETPAGAFEIGQPDNYAAGIELQQLVYAGGSVRAALRAAEDYRALTRAETRRTEAALRRRVRTAFHALLLARDAVAVREASLRQVRDAAEDAERRYRAGTGSEFDALSARARAAAERPELLAAQRDYQLARMAFRDLARLPVEDFEPDGELTWTPIEIGVDAVARLARERRPEIEAMALQLDLMRADVRVEQGNRVPEFRVRAAYSGTDPAVFSASDGWEWRWEAGVVARWSIFDGGLTRERIRQKRLALDRARVADEDLRRAVALEAAQAALTLRHAAESVEAASETVDLAERALEIARVRFESGTATWLEFNEANLALRTARLAHARALRDHMDAVAGTAFAAGLTVEELRAEEAR